MAWTRGNKQWTFTFKSLAGVTCRVDIYKAGSQIPTPLTLTPADNPFYYEEDNDDDLLNNNIRYKTGYIRIMQNPYQSITDLYPTSDDEHYVEFYYGSRLDFIGFMQTQDFSNDYTAYPRVVEFPVASPLYMLSGKLFTTTDMPVTPGNMKLGTILDLVMAHAYGIYTHVMFPYFSDILLNSTIYSLVINPWNEEMNHVDTSITTNPVNNPKTLEFFLDALCKAFGWILHDDVTYLTFSMFDYKNRYAIYPVGHIGDLNYLNTTDGEDGGTPVELENYLTFADNSAKTNYIMPYSRIKINYDGDEPQGFDDRLSFTRTYNWGSDAWNDTAIVAVFLHSNIGPSIGEINPAGISDYFDSVGRFANGGVHVVAFYTSNNQNVREGIAYAVTSENQTGQIFSIRLYTKFADSYQNWKVSFDVEVGTNLLDLAQNDENAKFAAIAVSTQQVSPANYVQFNFSITQLRGTWSSRDVILFSNISFFINNDNRFSKYTQKTTGFDLIEGAYKSYDEGEITMPISRYRKNTNMIGVMPLRTDKVTEYPYLLNPRHELQAQFKVNTPINHQYCKLWKYDVSTYRWRIIAYSFEPWNDEMTLTMERSTTLNS